MTVTDYTSFASMMLLLIGSLNWGIVAMRYSFKLGLPDPAKITITANTTSQDLYGIVPVPDLIELVSSSASTQALVYYLVFAAGVVYTGLFFYMSITQKDED